MRYGSERAQPGPGEDLAGEFVELGCPHDGSRQGARSGCLLVGELGPVVADPGRSLVPPEETLTASRLAEYHGVPAPYLAKALQALARSGIAESSTGRHGGYRLARPASAISLLDVVDAVEGGARAFRCTEIRRRGPSAAPARCYRATCTIAAAMWAAEDAWRLQLASVSGADLAEAVAAHAPPAAAERTTAWLAGVLGQRSGSGR